MKQFANLIGTFRCVHVVVQDRAVDVVYVMYIPKRKANIGFDETCLGRLHLCIAKGDLNYTRGVLELSLDFENFTKRVELRFNPMRWRAESQKTLCKDKYELLIFFHT